MIDITYAAATSLDGYIATEEAGVDWLTPFQSEQDRPIKTLCIFHARFDYSFYCWSWDALREATKLQSISPAQDLIISARSPCRAGLVSCGLLKIRLFS
jgi:hypothetical protein